MMADATSLYANLVEPSLWRHRSCCGAPTFQVPTSELLTQVVGVASGCLPVPRRRCAALPQPGCFHPSCFSRHCIHGFRCLAPCLPLPRLRLRLCLCLLRPFHSVSGEPRAALTTACEPSGVEIETAMAARVALVGNVQDQRRH